MKLLSADVVDVPDRMRRFVQEARAASSLNHPNILTIYEIDDTASGQFMAAEFVDGETLRERMRGRPMPSTKPSTWRPRWRARWRRRMQPESSTETSSPKTS